MTFCFSQRSTIKNLCNCVLLAAFFPKANKLWVEHTFVNKKLPTVQINISSQSPFPLWKANFKIYAQSCHVFKETLTSWLIAPFMNVESFYEVVKFGVIKALKIDYSFKNSFENVLRFVPKWSSHNQHWNIFPDSLYSRWNTKISLIQVEQNTIFIPGWIELYPGGIE